MLLFGSFPMGVDGEPLLPGLTAFSDHLNSKAIYYLPPALELLTSSEGDPDFFLLRYHGDFTQTKGGWLRFRLGFNTISATLQQELAAYGWSLQTVYFHAGR